MKAIGNILWVIFGGAVGSGLWFLYGVLFSLTIIGIPLGKQCFKLAGLTFMPFNKEITEGGGSAVSIFANVIWALVCGITMFLENLMMGIALCITIIGIPFGKQYFKLARLSLMPFGVEVKRN